MQFVLIESNGGVVVGAYCIGGVVVFVAHTFQSRGAFVLRFQADKRLAESSLRW